MRPLSDRLGRVPVILLGLGLFAAGSVVAALSETIHGVIAGRLLQGAGAVSATLTAMLADRTRPEVRTRTMALLGVGIGVLIRSQIGAVLTGTVAYVIGTFLIQQVVFLLYFLLDWGWIMDLMVLWPGVASQVMISPEPTYPGSPAWWVGALVLIGYGVGFGVIGTLLTRRRDVS